MPDGGSGPWLIALRRSTRRLLLVVGTRGLIGVAALLTALNTFGVIGTILNVAGAVVVFYSVPVDDPYAAQR